MTERPSPWPPTDPSKELGIMAVVGMAVCCGIPLLLGATSLAVTGAVLGSGVLIIAAVALAALAFSRARARTRHNETCCDTPVENALSDPSASHQEPRS